MCALGVCWVEYKYEWMAVVNGKRWNHWVCQAFAFKIILNNWFISVFCVLPWSSDEDARLLDVGFQRSLQQKAIHALILCCSCVFTYVSMRNVKSEQSDGWLVHLVLRVVSMIISKRYKVNKTVSVSLIRITMSEWNILCYFWWHRMRINSSTFQCNQFVVLLLFIGRQDCVTSLKINEFDWI